AGGVRHLAVDEVGAGPEADDHEPAADLERGALARDRVFQHEVVRPLLIPLDLHDLLLPDHLDLRIREGPLLQDLRGPELVAPVYDVHLAGVAGEIVRLLDRRVPPPYHGEHLALEERAVAHRAVRHALPRILLLPRHAELHRRAAGREDHRRGAVHPAAGGAYLEYAVLTLAHALHHIGDDLRPEFLGMIVHLLRELPPLAALDSGAVIDQVGVQ